MKKILILLAAATLLSSPLQAQLRTWNLGSFSGNSTVPTGGCAFTSNGTGVNNQGNVANCSANASSSTSLTVGAYSLSGSQSSSTVSKATLKSWGTSGVGVCNTNEYAYCSSPNHATDNFGTFSDFVLLQYTAPVMLNSVSLGWIYSDNDFSVLRWIGTGNPAGTIDGKTVSQLLAPNNWSVFTTITANGVGTYNLGNTSAASSYWIVAAYNPALATNPNADAGDDAFKISGVTATVATVAPEPSTYALMTAGLLGVFGVARRRRQA
jgi:hypothetical protein